LEPPTVGEVAAGDAERAWETYQQSLAEPPWLKGLEAFHQLEEPWVQNRPRILEDLQSRNENTAAWADRLETELLPAGWELIRQFTQDPSLKQGERQEVLAYLDARVGCWQILRDALRQQSPELIPKHQELWDASGMMMLSAIQGHLVDPLGGKHPAEAAAEFQAALVSFTPRLLVLPAIIAINVIVNALMVIQGVHPLSPGIDEVLAWGGNFGPKTINGEWWRLVTCMFLHYGIIHLAFNMWVLWEIGQLVERLVGHVGFFLLYMLSGVLGSLSTLVMNPERVVSAGASGAVFGVCGALLGFILLRRDTVPKEALAHLKGSMTAFLGFNLVLGFMIPNIDMAAHVGGLIGGLVCGAVLSQPLSREMVRKRPLRNVLAFMAGAAACGLAFTLVPKNVLDIEAAFAKVEKLESQALDAYNHLLSQQLTDEEFANRIEAEVLPPWKALRELMAELKQSKAAKQDVIEKFDRSFELREEAWNALIRSAREQKPELIQEFNEKWKAANTMVEELN
jgi:rhomboid protease GluP